MAIQVNTTFVRPSGFDMHDMFERMLNGDFSYQSTSANLVTFTHGLQTLNFHGTFTATTSSITGVSLTSFAIVPGGIIDLFAMDGGGAELFATSTAGTFMAANFTAEYRDEMRVTFTGDIGDDIGWGSASNDLLLGRGGDDILLGRRGGDVFRGGNGEDFVSGAQGKDTILGHKGRDLLRGEQGDDTIKGGKGNDLIEGGAGVNTVWGNSGRDTFIFDSGTNGQTSVKDYNPADIILITGVGSTASSNPEGVRMDLTGGTLADIPNGDIDGLGIVESATGHLRITFGKQTIILRNTNADDVALDQLYFADASSDSVLAAYGSFFQLKLGGAIEGTVMVGRSDGLVIYGDDSSNLTTYGVDVATFSDFL